MPHSYVHERLPIVPNQGRKQGFSAFGKFTGAEIRRGTINLSDFQTGVDKCWFSFLIHSIKILP